MNTVSRIVLCSAIAALCGVSGCIVPGHMRHDGQRDQQGESHRGNHDGNHDGNRDEDHGGHGRADCDQHNENCPEHERHAN